MKLSDRGERIWQVYRRRARKPYEVERQVTGIILQYPELREQKTWLAIWKKFHSLESQSEKQKFLRELKKLKGKWKPKL